MTTDTKTPDPTPALLPPARLADYRALLAKAPTIALTSSHGSIFPSDEAEQQARFGRRLDPTILQAYGTTEEMHPWAEFFAAAPDMVRALLSHLDALTPRAVPDGEALALSLREQSAMLRLTLRLGFAPKWIAPIVEELRAAHAAGRSEGEAAGAAERIRYAGEQVMFAIEQAQRDAGADRFEIARQRATIARLTAERDAIAAELAGAQAESVSNRRLFESSRDSFDRYKHEHNDRAVATADAARLAGAREERRLAILDMLTVARETHPSAQPAVHEAMRELGKLVNARGEGQGS